jgi:hypothetical protein
VETLGLVSGEQFLQSAEPVQAAKEWLDKNGHRRAGCAKFMVGRQETQACVTPSTAENSGVIDPKSTYMASSLKCPCGHVFLFATEYGFLPEFCPSCKARVENPIVFDESERKPPQPLPLEEDDDEFPRPLSDPLRGFRKFIGWVMVFQLLCSVAFPLLVVPLLRRPPLGLSGGLDFDRIFAGLVFLLPMPFQLPIFRILPNRVTNAFYLRSFRNDPVTWPIRKRLQAEFGRDFRLSGIRDPRHRWPPVLRMLLTIVFCFRYVTPKYMNLEAGNDWKARLWRSLADARCAIIDLTDMTPFVEEEIILAEKCLGLSRILFITDSSRLAGEWQQKVAAVLQNSVSPPDVQIALWSLEPEASRQFTQAVQDFRARLPVRAPGLVQEAYPLVASTCLTKAETSAADRAFWLHTLIGMVLANVIIMGYIWLIPTDAEGFSTWLYPIFAAYIYLWILGVNYLVECGDRRERVIFGSLFLGSVIFYSFLNVGLIKALDYVRVSADIAATRNQLKQIGMGFMYYSFVKDGKLPAQAIRDNKNKKTLLSWRVAILPFIEEEQLYSEFNIEESWDSAHNIKLLDRIPKAFVAPKKAKVERHMTFFQVVVARDGLFGQSRSGEDLQVALGKNAIPDGLSRTILVVEASRAVPWTKPEDVEWEPGTPMPEFGNQLLTRFHVLACNGASHLLPRTIDPGKMRALITRDGDEPVDFPP